MDILIQQLFSWKKVSFKTNCLGIEKCSLSKVKTYLQGLNIFWVCLRPILKSIKTKTWTMRSVWMRLYVSPCINKLSEREQKWRLDREGNEESEGLWWKEAEGVSQAVLKWHSKYFISTSYSIYNFKTSIFCFLLNHHWAL